jgi:hypothetical protein
VPCTRDAEPEECTVGGLEGSYIAALADVGPEPQSTGSLGPSKLPIPTVVYTSFCIHGNAAGSLTWCATIFGHGDRTVLMQMLYDCVHFSAGDVC